MSSLNIFLNVGGRASARACAPCRPSSNDLRSNFAAARFQSIRRRRRRRAISKKWNGRTNPNAAAVVSASAA